MEKKSYYKLNDKVKLYGLDEGKISKNIIVKNYRRVKKLHNIVNQINPNVIISFLPEPSYRILFLKLLNRKLKVIVSVRNDPKVEYRSIVNRCVMKILYPLADGFIFQTQEAKEYFSPKIQNKSIIIPNPINEEFICEPYNKERKKIIVTVGRLEEQKNHKMLIEAFSKLPEQFNKYKLIIYGEGSLRNELTKQINTLGLENRVILMGEVDNIKEEIYKSSLFVLSSQYEGMPNALMEAMALGIPCISTDCPCGGPRFLINNNINGFLVKNKNSEEMTVKIQYLLDMDQAKTKDIINRAQEKINEIKPSKIYSMWLNFIKETLGE